MELGAIYSWGLPCGSFRGIRIRIHWTLLGMWLFELHDFLQVSEEYAEAGLEGPNTRVLLLAWLVWTVAVSASILLHEFGHAFTARAMGGDAEEVLLWPLGGLALCRVPNVPRSQFLLAAGGPLASVAVVVSSWFFFLVLEWVAPDLASSIVAGTCRDALLYWNMIILIFNLIPLYPFDGGRMFQAALWGFYHRRSGGGWSQSAYARASLITVYTSRVMAILGILYFVVEHFRGQGNAIGILLFVFAFFEIERLRARIAEGADEDSFMGYDFSHGYTSLEDRQEEVSKQRRSRSGRPWRRLFGDPGRRRAKRAARETEDRRRVDELLEKISREGMDSLSTAERRFLEKASRRRRDD